MPDTIVTTTTTTTKRRKIPKPQPRLIKRTRKVTIRTRTASIKGGRVVAKNRIATAAPTVVEVKPVKVVTTTRTRELPAPTPTRELPAEVTIRRRLPLKTR